MTDLLELPAVDHNLIEPWRYGGVNPDLVLLDQRQHSFESPEGQTVRRSGLGGSEIAAAIGQGKYDSPWTVWQRKLGHLEGPQPSEPMYWGHALENAIGQRWQEDHPGIPISKPELTFRHPEYSWAFASPDFFAGDDGMVEVKTCGHYAREQWDDDRMPKAYMIQTQFTLGIIGRKWCDTAVLIAGQDYRVIRTHADTKIMRALLAAGGDFWDMVTAGIRPDPDYRDDVASFYPESAGDVIELSDKAKTAAADVRRLQPEIKALKEEEATAKNIIRDALGECTEGVDGDRVVATWRPNVHGKRTLNIK